METLDLTLIATIIVSVVVGILIGVAACWGRLQHTDQQIETAAIEGNMIAVGRALVHVVTPQAHYRYKVAEKFMHDSLKRRAERTEFLDRFNS